MIGHYSTIDGSEYEVYKGVQIEEKKRTSVLMARCTKSKTKTDQPFMILESNIQRMLNFGSWWKIKDLE